MGSRVRIDFEQLKGVVARRRILDVDGVERDMEWGSNELELPPGEHQLRAYLRAPLGNKVGATKPLSVRLEDGQELHLRYHAVGSAFSREFRLEIAGQEAPPPAPMPAWAWFFIVACAAIPVIAVGGAIPAALGVMGAGGCAQASRSERLSVPGRVLTCLLITGACWLLFVAVVLLVRR